MTYYTFRPIQWDGTRTPVDARRSRWTFKASWSDTIRMLESELLHLAAKRVVIEADFRDQDLRVDGMPRSNARQPEFPGVRIAFDSKYGPLVYATDAHAFWQHNVRAIALSLAALRSVDRYGVTKRAEQYTGWRAIGAGPTAMPAGKMTRQDAAEFIASHQPSGDKPMVAGLILAGDTRLPVWYRFAARKLHPDGGGSTTDFQRLQQAMTVLNG